MKNRQTWKQMPFIITAAVLILFCVFFTGRILDTVYGEEDSSDVENEIAALDLEAMEGVIEYIDDSVIGLPEPDKVPGYTFLGWCSDPDGSRKARWYQPGDRYEIEGENTLYAIWQKGSAVVLDAGDGKILYDEAPLILEDEDEQPDPSGRAVLAYVYMPQEELIEEEIPDETEVISDETEDTFGEAEDGSSFGAGKTADGTDGISGAADITADGIEAADKISKDFIPYSSVATPSEWKRIEKNSDGSKAGSGGSVRKTFSLSKATPTDMKADNAVESEEEFLNRYSGAIVSEEEWIILPSAIREGYEFLFWSTDKDDSMEKLESDEEALAKEEAAITEAGSDIEKDANSDTDTEIDTDTD
ncbi:MAG: InlB B-repeat-containing protein, partial [Eubacteriales bacterium]|nr:InlB B-repeat-containing protein [Eubacteriales bacterium]